MSIGNFWEGLSGKISEALEHKVNIPYKRVINVGAFTSLAPDAWS